MLVRYILRRLMLAVSTCLISFPVLAAYPDRAITLIVPFAAGGTTDLVARLLAEKMFAQTGVNVVVENKPGAGGLIGAQQAAIAKADGYTLLFGSDSLILQPILNKKTKVSVKDFNPLVRIRTAPSYFGVGPSLPVKDARELIELAKKNPGKYTFGTGGIGEINHMAGEIFSNAAGIELRHVPYKGAMPAATDTVGGRVDILIGGSFDVSQHILSGKLNVIAQTGTQRSLSLPDIPTFTELGYPKVVVLNWNGVLAPLNTPKEALDWLTENISKVAESKDFLEHGKELGLEPGSILKGKAFADSLRKASEQYEGAVKSAGIKVRD